MGRVLMPLLPRERPACPPGDGGHHFSLAPTKQPPPPRRERGAAAPEAPKHEATVSQGGKEVGEVGAEEGIEPSPESMEE